MQYMLRKIPYKATLGLSILVLVTLSVLNFYGIYTNRFYFFKLDGYVFLLLAMVHMVYLYVVQFKIREMELPDPKMRNLEYFLYALLLVYIYKVVDSFYVLLSYEQYKDHDIPSIFVPMAGLMTGLYILLVILSLAMFAHRKALVGEYTPENFGDHIDSWE